MKENPANKIKDTMWKFLMDYGQEADIQGLKESVYDLIGMTTQKTAGQRKGKNDIPWDEVDMTLMTIVIQATGLVLSGKLGEIQQDSADWSKERVDEAIEEYRNGKAANT